VAVPDVVVRRTYPDPVEEVWAAFTQSPRLARWYGTYTGTGGPGGTVEFTVTGEVDAGGEVAEPVTVRIHECEAPRRLVVEFPVGDQGWLVEVTLSPADAGTDVVLSQHAVPDVTHADLAAGWAWYLDRLGATLRGETMPDWAAYAP
jgi:uncharacterized protein YndB with AHSA1/START domain